ncbi:MAG: L-2,4-diaminobutyrate decarboxylase [Cyanobacteria bacterium RYN_339]|nr:L-2,4-diaminobutyrate decarboxylase [Cyanobacteria bacterium RYN_339]
MSDLYDAPLFRTAGHQVVDRLADHLERMQARDGRAHPALQPLAAMQDFTGPMPAAPAPDALAAVLRHVDDAIDRTMHLHHPGCMGHQVAAPMPVSALADFVAGFLNQGMAVFETGQIGVLIERQTVRWLADAVGWGAEADGMFTSGGSLGNTTALLAARNLAGDGRSWTDGVRAEAPMVVLVSEQAHYSISRAAGVLGLGQANVIGVKTDADCRMDLAALRAEADAAEARGQRVLAVVGSACTTAAGAYDPLVDIGALCRERGYWFHVDGAHGASVLLSPRYKHLAAGIALADSIVWDAHKLLSVPSLATAVLFRRGGDNYAAFRQEASYLFNEGAETAFDLGLRTLECTKRMLAFKLWLAFQVHGADALGEMVATMHDRAREFAALVAAAPGFELLLPPESNIVCFRRDGDDALQEALRARVMAAGAYYLVQTRLHGRIWLRITVMNPATARADFEGLLEALQG